MFPRRKEAKYTELGESGSSWNSGHTFILGVGFSPLGKRRKRGIHHDLHASGIRSKQEPRPEAASRTYNHVVVRDARVSGCLTASLFHINAPPLGVLMKPRKG